MARTPSPRVERLRRKRDRLRKEIRTVDREIRELEKTTGLKAPRARTGGITPAAPLRRPNARRLNDTTVKEAIVQLLRERRKPMHYKDIARALVAEGRYRTKSKNFLSTVAITIMRDDRIERVDTGIYRLRAGS